MEPITATREPAPSKSSPRITETGILFLAFLVGAALTAWYVFNADIVNRDGAAYLLAAGGDWTFAESFGNWRFYPLMIGWLSDLTQQPVELVAHVLNGVFDAITLVFFLKLVQLFGGNRSTLIWAAIAFLVLTYFNDNRAEITRDHGFWALFMIGVWFYVRLYRVFSWSRALGWTLAMSIAALFRIEGVILLAIAPLGLLLNSSLAWRARWTSIFKTMLPVIAVVGTVGLLMFLDLLGVHQQRLDSLMGHAEHLYRVVTKILPYKATLLHDNVFPLLSRQDAIQGVYVVLSWGILKDFVESITPVFFLVLLLKSWFPRVGMSNDASRIIPWFLLLYFSILLAWAMIFQVMVSRYTQAPALLALVMVAFGLAHLHQRYKNERDNGKVVALFFVICVFVVLLFADTVIESPSNKTYIRDTAHWISSNLPEGAVVGVDDEEKRLRYYANRAVDHAGFDIRATQTSGAGDLQFRLVSIRDGKLRNPLTLKGLGNTVQPVAEITDSRGRGYRVYRHRLLTPAS